MIAAIVTCYILLLASGYFANALLLRGLAIKTRYPKKYFAWIPVANLIILTRAVGYDIGMVLMQFVPIANIVFNIIMKVRLFKCFNKNPYYILFLLIPVAGPMIFIVFYLMMIFSENSVYTRLYPSEYQPNFNGQPNYNQQAGFNGQPNYNQQAGFNGQPNYNQQAGFNGQPNYNQQAGFNGQPNYNQQAGFNGQPNYNQQAGFNGQATGQGYNTYGNAGNRSYAAGVYTDLEKADLKNTLIGLISCYAVIVISYIVLMVCVCSLSAKAAESEFNRYHNFSINSSIGSRSDDSELDSSDSNSSSSSENSNTTAPSGMTNLNKGGIDKLSFKIDGTEFKVGDQVSKLTGLGYTIDDSYKNATVDNTHYASVQFSKEDKQITVRITSNKDQATPALESYICGICVDDFSKTDIQFNNGLKIGMSLDEYKAHFSLPDDPSNITTVDNGVSYNYDGTDKYNTSLYLNFYENKLTSIDYDDPSGIS
ncbi:MAG TPA: hypothetical protein VHO66_09670 [Ruminiclostridium sp.]|nr:hypothetical protein [Ruminiclostridium sp.]